MKMIVRHDPLSRMERMFDEMFRPSRSMFNRQWDDDAESISKAWFPGVDIQETEDAFIIHADIPGMNREDIKVELEAQNLTIKGERKFDREENKENYHLVERNYGCFYRNFRLPSNVDPDNTEAEYKDGVLMLKLGKKPETKPRSLNIK